MSGHRSTGPWFVGRIPGGAIEAMVERAASQDVTYEPVGITLRAHRGEELSTHQRTLGDGPDTFDRAVAALRAWRCHDGIRARVIPADAPIEVGTTVAIVLPLGIGAVVVPDRVVAVIDEPDRFGFAYGTLPGHQEQGEESFLVERDASGVVTATIRIHATGATLLTRVAGPVVRLLQSFAARRYLTAWARATRSVP